ncbi:hypothetical protein TNCV_4468061 [Trichonephila clavipes]|nr:hypothetical protein TNCV_4468061 [Trichonephila clavipes]
MARQLLCFPIRFGSQPWRLEQPKKWENWSRAMLLSSSPIFLGTVSRMFSMGWVPCRGDRYYSRPSVATNIASETHGHSVFSGQCIGQMEHTSGTRNTVSGHFSA